MTAECKTCHIAFKTKSFPTIDEDGETVMVEVVVEATISVDGERYHSKPECLPGD